MSNPVQWLVKGAASIGALFFKGKPAIPAYTTPGATSNGTNGTLAGVADPGALLIGTNVTSGVTKFYQNTNTKASPTWTALTTSSGAGTYTGTFDGQVGSNTPAAGVFTTGSFSGLVANGVTTGITASTTQTRAGGTALTKTINRVTTSANSGDAVTLPAMTAGQSVFVFNDGANPIKVFPNGASDAIDGGSGGASVTLTNAKRAIFICTATNVIISAQLGVTAA